MLFALYGPSGQPVTEGPWRQPARSSCRPSAPRPPRGPATCISITLAARSACPTTDRTPRAGHRCRSAPRRAARAPRNWAGRRPRRPGAPNRRAAVRVYNFGDQPASEAMVSADPGDDPPPGRGAGWTNGRSACCSPERKSPMRGWAVPCCSAATAARSAARYDIYFADDAARRDRGRAAGQPRPGCRTWLKTAALNRASRYPADGLLQPPQSPGVKFSLDDPGRRRSRCPVGRGWTCRRSWPEAGRGWRQSVAVKPGRTYLVAAWIKCKDATGDARARAPPHGRRLAIKDQRDDEHVEGISHHGLDARPTCSKCPTMRRASRST